MDTELLTDEKYEELLRSRTEPLTKSQIHQLRQIDRTETMLNLYAHELPEDTRNEVFRMLRRRQMEILTNENEGSWERFLKSLPDPVIDIF